MIRPVLVFLLLGVFLGGCAKFGEGDCIQNVNDGHVWRITAVHFNKYTAQGWFDGKWGLLVDFPFDLLNSSYVKIPCPFSNQTLEEQR